MTARRVAMESPSGGERFTAGYPAAVARTVGCRLTGRTCVMADLADGLRLPIAAGDWGGLRERLARDAVLRTSNEAGRQRLDGADAVVAHLARPGPGEIRAW